MNPVDPVSKANATPEGPSTPGAAGARADVKISSGKDVTKVSVNTDQGATAKGWAWPKDNDEWRRYLRAAIPWVAGAVVVFSAVSAMKSPKEGEESSAVLPSARQSVLVTRRALLWRRQKESAYGGWFGLKRKAEDVVDEAEDKLAGAKGAAARKADEARGAARETQGYVKEKAQEAKEGAKDAGRWAGHKAHDAADAAKSTYRSAADTANRAAHKVEEKVGAAGSAALATASGAEEKTGKVMKDAGERLEADGAQSRRYYRGEQVKQEQKNKWGCTIM